MIAIVMQQPHFLSSFLIKVLQLPVSLELLVQQRQVNLPLACNP
jgi:hypothetical protein